MTTNAQIQRVLEQIEKRIKEAFLAVNTFEEVGRLRNHFEDYIATGIKKMTESKVWEDREISYVKNFAEACLNE